MMAKFELVPGVKLVEPREAGDSRVTFEVHAEKGLDVRPELARAAVESQWKLLELKTSGLSLEDIFLKLTTKDVSEESVVSGPSFALGPAEHDSAATDN
jgi:hypothetical protein